MEQAEAQSWESLATRFHGSKCAGDHFHSGFNWFSSTVAQFCKVRLPLMSLLWVHPSFSTVDTGPSPETSSLWTSSSSAHGWTRSQWGKSRPSCLSASGLRCRCRPREHLGEREGEGYVKEKRRRRNKQGFLFIQTSHKLILKVTSASGVEGALMCTNQTSIINVMCILVFGTMSKLNFLVCQVNKKNITCQDWSQDEWIFIFSTNMSPCLFSVQLVLYFSSTPAVCHHMGINFQLMQAAQKQKERYEQVQALPFCV